MLGQVALVLTGQCGCTTTLDYAQVHKTVMSSSRERSGYSGHEDDVQLELERDERGLRQQLEWHQSHVNQIQRRLPQLRSQRRGCVAPHSPTTEWVVVSPPADAPSNDGKNSENSSGGDDVDGGEEDREQPWWKYGSNSSGGSDYGGSGDCDWGEEEEEPHWCKDACAYRAARRVAFSLLDRKRKERQRQQEQQQQRQQQHTVLLKDFKFTNAELLQELRADAELTAALRAKGARLGLRNIKGFADAIRRYDSWVFMPADYWGKRAEAARRALQEQQLAIAPIGGSSGRCSTQQHNDSTAAAPRRWPQQQHGSTTTSSHMAAAAAWRRHGGGSSSSRTAGAAGAVISVAVGAQIKGLMLPAAATEAFEALGRFLL